MWARARVRECVRAKLGVCLRAQATTIYPDLPWPALSLAPSFGTRRGWPKKDRRILRHFYPSPISVYGYIIVSVVSACTEPMALQQPSAAWRAAEEREAAHLSGPIEGPRTVTTVGDLVLVDMGRDDQVGKQRDACGTHLLLITCKALLTRALQTAKEPCK